MANQNKVQELIRKYAAGVKLISGLRSHEQELLTKVAEMEGEVTKVRAEAKAAVENAVEAVKKGAEVATSENADAMSDAAKNAIVEAVSRVDHEAGTQLAEAIDDAEKVDGEKLAGMVVDVFRSIESRSDDSFGTLRASGHLEKNASQTGAETKFESVLDDITRM